MTNTEFSKLLRKWRGKRYQKEAASDLNVELPTYLNWEHGRNQPDKYRRAEIERLMAEHPPQ